MPRITLRQLLDHAAENDYGVPAFNINNMEQALAIMDAASTLDAPVIIQASRGARSYANDIMLKHMMDAVTEIYPQIPVCVHLDHGNGPDTCMTAIQAGFTSVMMDGSLKADGKTAADWDYNVGVTKKVTDMAHLGGISVEGELGVLGSLETGMGDKEDGHGAEGKLSHDQLLTNPDEAVKFVRETEVDALAIAMGTSHGAYKFTRKPDGDILAMNVIEEIHRKLPNTHLVMHGSSSVPQDLQDIINTYGGKMKPTWGVPVSRNPARHQERRAQDQHRHRQPHGDDRPDPQSAERGPRRIRSAQISEARDGGDGKTVQAAPAGVQYRRPGQQDQEGADHRRDGEALCRRGTDAEGGVNAPADALERAAGLSSYMSWTISWDLPENRPFQRTKNDRSQETSINLAELNKIANAMVAPGKGILAADESSGTIKKRFDAIKVESTEDNRRDYREMLFRSKEAMSNYISGVILYDETIWQKAKDGTPLVKLIEQAGAIPGIKVDEGTQPLPNCPGELITVGLDKLAERLKKYYDQGARFAKWRAVIDIGKGIPSYAATHTNAHALARYAALCQQAQIVPIVEPEVLMDGDHGIDQCFEVTAIRAEGNVSGALLSEGRAGRHDPETQHGDLGQEGANPRRRRRGRGENRSPAQKLRAGRGAGHRVPVRRAVRRGGHRPSRRHEPDRRPAVEADLLLRPRAAGRTPEGVVGQGGECSPPASRRSPIARG